MLTGAHLLLVVCSVVLLAGPLRAQSGPTTGTISGTVTDEAGAILVGATVVAVATETGWTRDGITDGLGHYAIAALPPGQYTLRWITQLCDPGRRTGDAWLGAHLDLPLALRIAPLQTAVTVQAAAPDSTLRESAGATSLSAREIDRLPTNGRNVVAFSLLATGVVADRTPQQGAAATSGLTFVGQRARSNNITVDGLDNNDRSVGSVRATVSQEAVQELQVLAHSYGVSSAAPVAVSPTLLRAAAATATRRKKKRVTPHG